MAQAGIYSTVGTTVRQWLPTRQWLISDVVLDGLLPNAESNIHVGRDDLNMKHRISSISLLVVLPLAALWLLFSTKPVLTVQASTIVYVNQAVLGGNNDGTSWADAYSDLQTALAASPPDSDDELWVAAGVYKPTNDTNREATFQLKSGVALYGGFAGTETERGQRDWTVNITVLSGDIDNNDMTTPAGVVTDTANIVGDNSYHVVTGSGVANTAVLDGFIITAGNANGDYPHHGGGGITNSGGSPRLTHLTFSGNSAYDDGGGMYNLNSSPILTDVAFKGNGARHGGGMYSVASFDTSSPTLTNITFSDNSAEYGAGVYIHSEGPHLTNVSFNSNSTGNSSGLTNTYLIPSLTNVTFSGNSAAVNGGGMYIYGTLTSLTNVTFSGNSAINSGGGIYSDNGLVLVSNSLIANSLSGGDCAGAIIRSTGYNIDSDDSCDLTSIGDMPNTDPLLDPLADNGGYTFTHMPREDSPAIDAGDPHNCTPTDQRGVPRPYDKDGGCIAVCDIGSTEYYPASPLAGVVLQRPVFVGNVQTDYTFTAVVIPISATQPITYVWQTIDQPPVTHTSGITDTAVISWNTFGDYVLTVTANNPAGSATACTIVNIRYVLSIYLPIANKP